MNKRHAPIARYRIHRSDGNGKGESLYTDDTTTAAEAAKEAGVVVEELLVDKAAIVAELERLASDWHQRNLQDAKSDLIAPHAFSSGIASGLSLALKVVQAGGALPLESEEKVEGN
jgi:hypothetical protein